MKGLLYKLHLENIKFGYVFARILCVVMQYYSCFKEIRDVSFTSVGWMILISFWNLVDFSRVLPKEEAFVCTLPVKKSHVVSSKYIYYSINKFISIVLFLALNVLVNGHETFPKALIFIAFCDLGLSFNAILFPLLFAGLKGLFTLLGIPLMVFSGIISVFSCSNVIKSGINLIPASIAIILASVAIYVASWFLSVIAYENREF